MTTKLDPADEEDAIRVTLFRTQAVGIVDRAANGETFLALKSAGSMDGQDPQAAPPAEAQKAPEPPPVAALKMPSAVKAAMTEALGAVLDTCAKMADALQGAEIDDAAPVPPSLLEMAMAVEDAIGAMVEPYEDAMMAAPPPVAPVEGEQAQKAAPPPPAKGPRPRLAMKRIMAMDGVSKMLTDSAQKLGDLVSWAKGAAGMPAPPMGAGMSPAKKADLDPFTALNATLQAVRDRMWAACDMVQKDPAKAIAELREVGGMLDKAAILATGGGQPMTAPAPAEPVALPPQPMMDAEMAQKAFVEVFAGAKADLLAAMKADLGPLVLTAQGAAARAQAALQKVEKSVPASQSQPAGEIPAPPTGAPPPADPWLEAKKDIQETSQARRRPAAGK